MKKLFEFLKNDPQRWWKWSTIILIIVLVLSTCSHCTSKQNTAWEAKGHIQMIDSLRTENQNLKDSLVVLGNVVTLMEDRATTAEKEVEYLRGVVKDNTNRKPIIIYRENPNNEHK